MGGMKLLILGGTAFLGRTIATDALARGHAVTCAARGSTSLPPAGCQFVQIDRELPGSLDVLAADHWDAVVDVSRQPGQVRRAVRALEPATASYVFVSTASVYPDWTLDVIDETTPTLEPLGADEASIEQYGEGKVACENAVLDAFGLSRAGILRVGLIGGPGDRSGRSGYWPWRFAHPSGPDVLVPDADDQVSQLIDVRDLAAWIVTVCENRVSGLYVVDGPATTLGEALTAAMSAAVTSVQTVPVAEAWLLAHEVAPWMGPRSLPLWLGNRADRARFDTSAATHAGLVCRPLADTFLGALGYEEERPGPRPQGAGLSDDDERALLAVWASR
jgi:nucleoside-diphosphate-sugar epimerase